MEKYPIASPFYPVSPEKNNEMTEIAQAMQTSLITLLTKRGMFSHTRKKIEK
jgi:hypothetical protein